MKAALILLVAACLIACTKAENPLKGKKFYVDPTFRKNVLGTIANLPADAQDHDATLKNLKIASDTSTVCHLDKLDKVQPNNTDAESMNSILQGAANEQGVTVVFNLNFIPRDGECVSKLQTYKDTFIANIVSLVNEYKTSVDMAFIVEPNAVASLITDIDHPVCQDAETQKSVWKEAVESAVSELYKAGPNFPIYLGLGHGNWLGSDKRSKEAGELVNSWNVMDKIRGFATNVGNYQPVGKVCPKPLFCEPGQEHEGDECCANPCPYDPVYHDNNELNFALRMETFFPGKKYVIDTGRNGVSNARDSCSNWCNIRNAGLGLLPSSETATDLVDAYLWVNTPGKSTGCTEQLTTGATCTSFNPDCGSVDSIGTKSDEPRLPEAGVWSDYLMTMLARDANFNNVVVRHPPPTSTSTPAPTNSP